MANAAYLNCFFACIFFKFLFISCFCFYVHLFHVFPEKEQDCMSCSSNDCMPPPTHMPLYQICPPLFHIARSTVSRKQQRKSVCIRIIFLTCKGVCVSSGTEVKYISKNKMWFAIAPSLFVFSGIFCMLWILSTYNHKPLGYSGFWQREGTCIPFL